MHRMLLRTVVAFLVTGSPIAFMAAATPSEASYPVGVWETDSDSFGAVGINLWTASSSSGHGGPRDPEEREHTVLQVAVYQRARAQVQCGEENFFDTGWRGHENAGVRTVFTKGVLTVAYPQFPHETAIDVDLSWHPETDTWTGRFHRGNFDKIVVLHRAPDRPTHDQELCLAPSVMPK